MIKIEKILKLNLYIVEFLVIFLALTSLLHIFKNCCYGNFEQILNFDILFLILFFPSFLVLYSYAKLKDIQVKSIDLHLDKLFFILNRLLVVLLVMFVFTIPMIYKTFKASGHGPVLNFGGILLVLNIVLFPTLLSLFVLEKVMKFIYKIIKKRKNKI